MNILPSVIVQLLENFRPLMRVEVFETFTLLLTGLLVGEAKHGTVRSSVFAPADYQPARISDFFTTHRVSPQKLMARLTQLVLRLCHSGTLPKRMFWIADSTHTEKPYAEKIASLGVFHRTKRVVGRAKHLKGHCYVCAAHLYQHLDAQGRMRWSSAFCGALLYVKGRSIPALVGSLATQLRLPEGMRHVWIVDRGIISRTLLRALEAISQFALGRVKANQVVYFAPRRQPKRGRRKTYGQKCRVDQLVKRFPDRLRKQRGELHVQGKQRKIEIYDAEVLLRGVPGGSNIGLVAMIEVTALMIGEVVLCYSRERYENPQPILPGMLIERSCPKRRYRPGGSADVLIFQGRPISFDEDLIVNRDRGDVQSRFSLAFGQPLVETEVAVRSRTAKKIHHKIHKIT
jgi:hypothetical protein